MLPVWLGLSIPFCPLSAIGRGDVIKVGLKAHFIDFFVSLDPVVEILVIVKYAPDTRRFRAGKVPFGQPSNRAAIERSAQKIGIGLDNFVTHILVNIGRAAKRPGIGCRCLANDHFGNHGIKVSNEFLVIPARSSHRFEQADFLPVRHSDSRLTMDGR